MHNHFRIVTRLAEATRELCGLDDGALGNLFTRWVAHYDVRTGIVAGVHPEIVWLGYAKGEVIVVARGASHENLVAIS